MTDLDLAAIKAKAEAARADGAQMMMFTINGVPWFDVVLDLIARLEKAEADGAEQAARVDELSFENSRLRALLAKAGEALNGVVGARMEHGWRISGAGSLNAALPTAREVLTKIEEAVGHE